MRRHLKLYLLAVSLLVVIFPFLAEARVTRIVITSRQVVADAMSFGETGPYEKLRGTVYFEVDPDDPRNAVVFDLDKAPSNGRGMVEFSADMMIIKPVDMTKGNGRLFFEVNNRGNIIALRMMNDARFDANQNNPTSAGDFGNGWLLRQGYTLAWVGWESDIAPGADRLTVHFPVATDGGKPISELILTEFVDVKGASMSPVFTQPLPYQAVSTDQDVAMADLQARPSDSPRPSGPEIPPGEVIPRSQWSFASCPNGPPGVPSTRNICLPAGFENNAVYQLIFKATEPTVAGLGYVTTRDYVSFLRNQAADDDGNPNPIAGITATLCQGSSQSGGYLRDFVYQGFNEDEQGQRVCDGVHVHIMGVPKWALNYRFAQPNPSLFQHATRFKPDTNFPRTYAIRRDPVSGNLDGILKRPDTDPKIIHTMSSTEYWQLRASLLDTDEDGSVDLRQPSNVRLYLLAGSQHIALKGAPPSYGIGNRQCQQLSNPTLNGVLLRPLVVALDEWVRDDVEPPASRVPRIRDGTLVPSDRESTGFPEIPAGPTWSAVAYNGLFNGSGERDFGPRVSGNAGVIDKLTPDILSTHRVLVPKVNEIGIDIAGIHQPFVAAPIATLTGWNLRRPEFTDGDLCDINGMQIPLFRTKQERLDAGDPRPSLEELYHNHKGYVKAVRKAAKRLAHEGFLLDEDVDRIIQEADDSDVLK